jgi:hypothetical protein
MSNQRLFILAEALLSRPSGRLVCLASHINTPSMWKLFDAFTKVLRPVGIEAQSVSRTASVFDRDAISHLTTNYKREVTPLI